jgi:cytochrome b561
LAKLYFLTGETVSESNMSSLETVRYDSVTVALHWITAALVIYQFAAGELWDFLPRPPRHIVIQLHVSFGIILTLVILIRLLWRGTRGKILSPVGVAYMAGAARALHCALYLGLIGMALTGILNRWAAAQSLNFFWLFAVPSPFADFRAWHHYDARLHSIGAWIFIAAIGLHASAALIHHYIVRDDVLRRIMLTRRESKTV